MRTIVWFRQDLRLDDNPALAHAANRGTVIPLYILDETPPPRGRPIGGASRWWLHHSLKSLSTSLGGLVLLRGAATEVLPALVERTGATMVVWNRCYDPYAVRRDKALMSDLGARGIEVASFNGSLLLEPWQVATSDEKPFKVYSPFWRACLRKRFDAPLRTPSLKLADISALGDRLDDWLLLPTRPNWAKGFNLEWQPGEKPARKKLERFLATSLASYSELRNRPDLPGVTRLSPHLHWGEISPRQIWAAVHESLSAKPSLVGAANKLLSEIGWREFNHHLLYHFPAMAENHWRPAFDAYPWANNPSALKRWQKGLTGYPMVDAGMRELWATGYMHNRVRMITASFLVKHLRTDWRKGEAWFWDTLVDADLANNVASWQWVTGSGADAAPYFRIFNPIEQGRKFDPEGAYVRRWCPELTRLPTANIHAPFEADPTTLNCAGIRLGQNYPLPIVEHGAARRDALAGYEAVKRAAAAIQNADERDSARH